MTDKYYSGLKAMLEHVGRRKDRSTEQDFIAIENEVERKVNRVNYDFARSSYELGIYMIRKLRGRAKVTAEGEKTAVGYEMFRFLHQRYDRVTEDAEALMTAEISKCWAHPASSLKDLRDQLANLQSKLSEF